MTTTNDLLYRLARRCEALFNDCLALLQARTSSLVDKVTGYQTRFATWAADFDLVSPDSQSLDSKLQDHADIGHLVIGYLDILRCTLLQCESCRLFSHGSVVYHH